MCASLFIIQPRSLLYNMRQLNQNSAKKSAQTCASFFKIGQEVFWKNMCQLNQNSANKSPVQIYVSLTKFWLKRLYKCVPA